MSDLKLAFGLRSIPPDVRTAWGARLIWPNDLVYDRQDLQGPDSEDLKTWLNNGPLGSALEKAADLARTGKLAPSDEDTVALYEDEHGIVMANPQRSYGYLYVAAWLR